MKKAQSALEFVLLISFMLVVFVGFLIAIQTKILDVSKEKDAQYLKEVNNIVLNEVFLAQNSLTDYHHQFYIPTNIEGKGYNIELSEDFREIISTYDAYKRVDFFEKDVVGVLYQGSNNIHHLDGVINLGATTYQNDSYKGIFININPELCYMADHEYNDLGCEALEDHNDEYPTLCADLFYLCYNYVYS